MHCFTKINKFEQNYKIKTFYSSFTCSNKIKFIVLCSEITCNAQEDNNKTVSSQPLLLAV